MSLYNADHLPGLQDRTVLVTGATSGIGQATAAALAGAGARVVIAARNHSKAQAVAASIFGRVETRPLDLGDLESVRRFADGWTEPIDILINNAGVAARALERTRDGFELDFGTNHLGHFALTLRLLPFLRDRVVVLASQAERAARLDLDDPNWENRPYHSSRAYNDSKLANLLFTAELDRRLRADGSGVRALAAHPGLVVTPIYDKPAGTTRSFWDRLLPVLGQDAAHGALPVLYAATEDLPGNTFVGPQRLMHMRSGAEPIGRSAAAKDAPVAAQLWQISENLTEVGFMAP
ncbi:SDR family NAD(P)-dependent oxidoreductase [Sinomonas susongensis]|uniref:SDR family NAD(P)-dependent oxidoreductase n=1 Tax=Sinomonas susongensis TaxID=1324851 RepID=UPI0011088E7C|nr:SDR family NAD(P)-dependent oxidoreductase [Sinomonas susongensis]